MRPLSRDKSQATLTCACRKSYGKRIPVPETNWEFAASSKDPSTGKETIKPSSKDLYLHEGIQTVVNIYEFIYPAKNPLVLGLGFAVTRDLISFLRYESKDATSKPNPLASSKKSTGIDHAYAWGRSQSGRYLRDFVYHGFNEDESHSKSFRRHRAPCRGRRPPVFELRVRPPGYLFAAAHQSTRSRAFPARLQRHQRCSHGPARWNS